MSGGGSANASTTNQTSVSTNTITDSYNQAFTRVENLSDVGNVNISTPQDKSSPITVILIIGAAIVFFIMLKRKMNK